MNKLVAAEILLSDKDFIKIFAKKFGIELVIYTDPACINKKARKIGAVESIGFKFKTTRDEFYADINFEIDKNGYCVAVTTDQINSFMKRK